MRNAGERRFDTDKRRAVTMLNSATPPRVNLLRRGACWKTFKVLTAVASLCSNTYGIHLSIRGNIHQSCRKCGGAGFYGEAFENSRARSERNTEVTIQAQQSVSMSCTGTPRTAAFCSCAPSQCQYTRDSDVSRKNQRFYKNHST